MRLTENQKIIRDILIKVAQSPYGQISYSDVIRLAGLTHIYNINNRKDFEDFGYELGTISAYEVENGRPMLSSVVFSHGASTPGGGYFKLAQSLYGTTLKNQMDKLEFFANELKKTLEYWRKF